MEHFKLKGRSGPITRNSCFHSFVECIDIISDDLWKDRSNSLSFRTSLRIENLIEESAANKQTLVTDPREYQREKVSSLSWKQGLFRTILNDKIAKIPEVHLRSLPANEYLPYLLEVLDGQQRITAILDYIAGKYSLGTGLDAVCGFNVDGVEATLDGSAAFVRGQNTLAWCDQGLGSTGQ